MFYNIDRQNSCTLLLFSGCLLTHVCPPPSRRRHCVRVLGKLLLLHRPTSGQEEEQRHGEGVILQEDVHLGKFAGLDGGRGV
jgi:hypothetical protein